MARGKGYGGGGAGGKSSTANPMNKAKGPSKPVQATPKAPGEPDRGNTSVRKSTPGAAKK